MNGFTEVVFLPHQSDDFVIKNMNQAFGLLLNINVSDVIGKNYSALKDSNSHVFIFGEALLHNRKKPVFYTSFELTGVISEFIITEITENELVVVSRPLDLKMEKSESLNSFLGMFDGVFEDTVDAYFLLGNRVFVGCNHSAVKMLKGDSKAHIIGKAPHEISPEHQLCGTSSSVLAKEMMDIARTHGSHMFEWIHVRLNGEIFFAEVSLTYLYHAKNEYFLTIVRDISEKKQKEGELLEREKQFRMLAENSEDIIWLMDLQFNNLYISPAVIKHVGYTPEEFNEMSLDKRVHPEDLQRILGIFTEKINQAQQNQEFNAFEIEMRYLHKDGHYVWGQSYISAIRDENKRIVKIQGITRNIDEKKKFEHQLLLEKEKYRAIVDAYDGFLYICSSDYVVEFMNDNFIERTGYDGTGHKCFKALHDLDDVCEWCVNERVQKGESVKWQIKSPKDNRWFSVSNTPIFNPDGSISKQAMIQDITDSKLAELALKESEERFRALVELAVDGIVLGDEIGEIIEVNKRFLEITELKKPEVIGKSINDLFEKYVLEKEPLRYDLLNKGETVVREREFKKESGEIIIVEMHSKQMPNGTYQAFFRDVTHRKQSENLLKEQKRFLETLISNLPGIVYRCKNDRDWSMEFISGRCMELTGHESSAFINNQVRTFNSIIHKDHRERIWEKWQVVLKNKDVFVDEYVILTADGAEKWVYEQGAGVYDGNDELLALEGFIMDITDRKHAENALVKSQFNYKMLAGYNQLLSRAALVFAMADSTEELEKMVLSYFQQLTGGRMALIMLYNEGNSELYLKNFIIPDDIIPLVVDLLGDEFTDIRIAITPQIQKELIQVAVIKTNGIENVTFGSIPVNQIREFEKITGINKAVVSSIQRKNVLMGTLSAFMEEESEVPEEVLKTYSQLAGFALARKKTEKELIVAKEKAEQSDKMKSAFLANISHEIRTPMNAILGFTELLERENLSYEDRLKYTEIITDAGGQLLGIIDDLIDLAKIESGQMRIIHNKLDIVLLLKNLHELLNLKFERKGLDFVLKLDSLHEEFYIETDALRLKQILINLLDNAYKYTNSGEVVFGYNTTDKIIQFYVKDTGIGISSDDSSKIFERFVQLEDKQAGQFSGKGLGLSISKSLAEMLGGQIHLESAKHKGSVFYLNLPLKTTKLKN